MWIRRWWEVWDTEKFVPADFFTCWWRSTKFSFPPHQSFLTTTGKACCHSMVPGDESWFPSLWSRNNMTEQGMPTHIAQQKEAKSNALSGQCFWGCWRMHTNWVFVTRGNHQCYFLHSHTQEPRLCTAWQMSRERKRFYCNTTIHGPKLLLCARRGFKWLETSPPSTLQSRPSPLGQPWVCKGSDARVTLRDQWGSPEAVHCCL